MGSLFSGWTTRNSRRRSEKTNGKGKGHENREKDACWFWDRCQQERRRPPPRPTKTGTGSEPAQIGPGHEPETRLGDHVFVRPHAKWWAAALGGLGPSFHANLPIWLIPCHFSPQVDVRQDHIHLTASCWLLNRACKISTYYTAAGHASNLSIGPVQP